VMAQAAMTSTYDHPRLNWPETARVNTAVSCWSRSATAVSCRPPAATAVSCWSPSATAVSCRPPAATAASCRSPGGTAVRWRTTVAAGRKAY